LFAIAANSSRSRAESLNQTSFLSKLDYIQSLSHFLRFLDGVFVIGALEDFHGGDLAVVANRNNSIFPHSIALGRPRGNPYPIFDLVRFAPVSDLSIPGTGNNVSTLTTFVRDPQLLQRASLFGDKPSAGRVFYSPRSDFGCHSNVFTRDRLQSSFQHWACRLLGFLLPLRSLFEEDVGVLFRHDTWDSFAAELASPQSR
jgi:hypothetical protein